MNIHRLVSAVGMVALAVSALPGDPPAQSMAQQALVGISYTKPTAVQKTAPAPTPGVMALPTMQVTAPEDRTYRDVNQVAAGSNLLAPCMLYTKNLPQNRQFQALGAPLFPWQSDSPGTKLQPRFPLINLAW